MDKTRLYKLALNTWGTPAQIVMVMEEMSELQKELCKFLRGRENLEEIAEEIADVEIMLEQMVTFFDCADMVASQKHIKLERLEGRLKGAVDYEVKSEVGLAT